MGFCHCRSVCMRGYCFISLWSVNIESFGTEGGVVCVKGCCMYRMRTSYEPFFFLVALSPRPAAFGFGSVRFELDRYDVTNVYDFMISKHSADLTKPVYRRGEAVFPD